MPSTSRFLKFGLGVGGGGGAQVEAGRPQSLALGRRFGVPATGASPQGCSHHGSALPAGEVMGVGEG